MKRINLFTMIILAIIWFSSSGCALKAKGYGVKPSAVNSSPYQATTTTQMQNNNALLEQKMDKMIDGLNNLASAINKKPVTPVLQKAGKKPETGIFSKNNFSTKKTKISKISNLEKQVAKNSYLLNNVKKTLKAHANAIVNGAPKGMNLDPQKKYILYVIGPFKPGCAKLTDGDNCRPGPEKQVENALLEIEKEKNVIIGIYGFSSESFSADNMRQKYLTQKNQKISINRANSVLDYIKLHRKDMIKNINPIGLGQTWYWSSIKKKNQVCAIVVEKITKN